MSERGFLSLFALYCTLVCALTHKLLQCPSALQLEKRLVTLTQAGAGVVLGGGQYQGAHLQGCFPPQGAAAPHMAAERSNLTQLTTPALPSSEDQAGSGSISSLL